MLAAAAEAEGAEVIWDLLHYGWPDDLDIWTPGFVDRFAAFARAAARALPRDDRRRALLVPGQRDLVPGLGRRRRRLSQPLRPRPRLRAQGPARPRRASPRCTRCATVDPARPLRPLRAADRDPPRPRHRPPAPGGRGLARRAVPGLRADRRDGCGRRSAAIRASSTSSGSNYYPTNQWIHGGPPIGAEPPAAPAALGPALRGLTPASAGRSSSPRPAPRARAARHWLRTVAAEVRRARARGVPVEGHLPLSGCQSPRLGRRPALRERSARPRGPRRNPGRACAVAAAGRRDPRFEPPRDPASSRDAHAATVVRQATGRAEPQGRERS